MIIQIKTGYSIVALLIAGSATLGSAADLEVAGDIPLAGSYAYPRLTESKPGEGDSFPGLKAEAINGKLKVSFQGAEMQQDAVVTLQSSVDMPGHWPARHWVDSPMTLRGRDWTANLPIDAPEAPIVYFAESVAAGRTNVSPMRVCHPRKMGLDKPSRAFWPFLEGFETGTRSWRYLAGSNSSESPGAVEEPRSGQRAMLLRIPPGKVSVTVGTTLVRGWHARLKGATGVKFWARASGGRGKVRLALLANAFSEDQAVSILPHTIDLDDDWKQVDARFSEFPGLKTAAIDLLSLEFVGAPRTEFLVDDLELLGPWVLY